MSSRKLKKAKSFSSQMETHQTYVLESLKLKLSQKFGRATLAKTQVDMVRPILDDFVRSAVIQVETLVFGQKMPKEYQVTMLIPATWWQHLVDDHFPEWYKRWRPVKRKQVYRTISIDHWALLPQFDKVPPGEEITLFTQDYYDEPEIPEDDTKP